jgi:hypothetical protein
VLHELARADARLQAWGVLLGVVASVWVAWFALPWQRLSSASHERRHRRAAVINVVWCWGSWGAFVCVLWLAYIHQLTQDQMQHRVLTDWF